MYDDMGVPGEDPKWDIFAELHEYLESRFPLVYVEYVRCPYNSRDLNVPQAYDADEDNS